MMNKVWFRRLLLISMDSVFCLLALFVSLLMRFEIEEALPSEIWVNVWNAAPFIVIIHIAVFWVGGIYRILWRLADAEEVLRLILLGVVASFITLGCNSLFSWGIPRTVLALTSTMGVIASTSARLVWRLLRGGRLKWRAEKTGRSVMVVGAGEAGAYVVSRFMADALNGEMSLLLVDDDPLKQKQRIHGVQIKGQTKDIPELVKAFDVQEIIIAIPSLRGEPFTELVTLCNSTRCHVRVLSDPSYIGSDDESTFLRNAKPHLRELNVSDFLSRDEVILDTQSISDYLTDRTVLITGGGGSIGAELCRQVMKFSPKKLVIFDMYENDAFELYVEMQRVYGQCCPVEVLIGSIREKARLVEVFDEYKPQVVFHAAAHKHVSLMERSPAEAIKNNVLGTKNLLEVAASHGTERFVQLSTDKAVNPTNVMGATKRVTEMLTQMFAITTNMKCMAVRFGNVLGSHGSVIPLFDAQIKAGGPVTVTDPAITRYFMTIPEAAQLVLQAGGLANNGAIYVLDMGEPVKILDLAVKMIRFYGYEPGEDMQILFTGLREGEKLYEELMMEMERDQMTRTAHKKIAVAPPMEFDIGDFQKKLEMLAEAANSNDEHVREALAQVVYTYKAAALQSN